MDLVNAKKQHTSMSKKSLSLYVKEEVHGKSGRPRVFDGDDDDGYVV